MRTVTITIEQDGSEQEHDVECMMTINGRHYHDCLRGVLEVLANYDNRRKLTKEQKDMLKDIRDKCAIHFRSVYNVKRK